MSPIVYRMNTVLSRVVEPVLVGTNLGLFHCLWMLLSGRLLLSRGAVIPGLAALGLAEEAVRRAWAALAYGKWQVAQLLEAWTHLVREEQAFHAHQYGGYRPVACDLVGFFRPRLQDCPTKHYSRIGKSNGIFAPVSPGAYPRHPTARTPPRLWARDLRLQVGALTWSGSTSPGGCSAYSFPCLFAYLLFTEVCS